MKFIPVDKPHSWLQWPVKLPNCNNKHPHITAKFFGQTPLNFKAIEEACSTLPPVHLMDLSDLTWSPVKFGENIFVLALTSYPDQMKAYNNLFRFIRDEHKFQPHITVHEKHWSRIKQLNLTPQLEGLEIGKIELCVSEKVHQGPYCMEYFV